MFSLRRRSRTAAVEAQFCESCAQVCTAACRSAELRERVHTQAAQWLSPIR